MYAERSGSVTYTSRPRAAMFSRARTAKEWRRSWVRIGVPSGLRTPASRYTMRSRLPTATLLRCAEEGLPGNSHASGRVSEAWSSR